MLNEATMKIINENRNKLLLAESTDEIKDIVTKAGGEISAEDAEQLWNEIKHVKESLGQEIDDDEMDAVAGGADMDWAKDGCAATCEWDSWCFSNDKCDYWSVTYDNFYDTCPDGTPHEFRYLGQYATKEWKCKKCGYCRN